MPAMIFLLSSIPFPHTVLTPIPLFFHKRNGGFDGKESVV
jgi:hypothetical protein